MGKKRATGFGARLRELRLAAGLTQAELAERSGMHVQSLTKLELGEREPAWATALDLAQALGVSCEAFTQEPAGREPAGPGRPSKAPGEPASEPGQGEPAEASGEKPKRPRKRKEG